MTQEPPSEAREEERAMTGGEHVPPDVFGGDEPLSSAGPDRDEEAIVRRTPRGDGASKVRDGFRLVRTKLDLRRSGLEGERIHAAGLP